MKFHKSKTFLAVKTVSNINLYSYFIIVFYYFNLAISCYCIEAVLLINYESISYNSSYF